MSRNPVFRKLLPDLIREFGGSKQELAKAIGITPSSLSHLCAGAVPSIEVCLRLAAACGSSPSRVLRAAGKTSVADLIESLYGPAASRRSRGPRISPLELNTIATLRQVPMKSRRAVMVLLDASAAAAIARNDPPWVGRDFLLRGEVRRRA